MNNMDFSEVLLGLKNGKFYTRKGWGETFLFYAFSDLTVDIKDSNNLMVNKSAYELFNCNKSKDGRICVKTRDSINSGWTASQNDLLATDWQEYKFKKPDK